MGAPIAEDMEDWIFANYRWLFREFGGFKEFDKSQLVTPTPKHFPLTDDAHPEDVAAEIFELVKQYAGLENWPCQLKMVPDDEDLHDALRGIPHAWKTDGAAGTFSVRGNRRVVITYHERQLRNPTQLVATFAHELGHYLLATAKTDPPGTEEAEEPATDIAAVFMGFGIFTANGAFQFEQYSDGLMQGWRSSHLGYLGQDILAHALAIFALLKDIPEKEVRKHLDTNPSSFFKKSRKHLLKRRLPDLDTLRNL